MQILALFIGFTTLCCNLLKIRGKIMLKLHDTMEATFKDTAIDVIHTSEACNGFIRVEDETVMFKLQAGNVADYGVNGVQCEEMLEFVGGYLKTLDGHYPSEYNKKAIEHINMAIANLNLRTKDRVERGVEGKEEL